MPSKVAEPHKQLVALAIKVQNQCNDLLLDRNINQELRKARKEVADLRQRIDKFLNEFTHIAHELELGIQLWNGEESSGESSESE